MKNQCKGLNKTGANIGKRCKHKAKKGEEYCGHHLRTLRKWLAEAAGNELEGKLVEFPMVDTLDGAVVSSPNPFNVSEQVRYALDVAHGNRFYTQTKLKGGAGGQTSVKVFPDWAERARWLEIAFKFSQHVQTSDERTEEEIQAEIRAALGFDA